MSFIDDNHSYSFYLLREDNKSLINLIYHNVYYAQNVSLNYRSPNTFILLLEKII